MVEQRKRVGIGSVVHLRSGGVNMTVTGLQSGGVFADCSWHDPVSGDVKRTTLPVEALDGEAGRGDGQSDGDYNTLLKRLGGFTLTSSSSQPRVQAAIASTSSGTTGACLTATSSRFNCLTLHITPCVCLCTSSGGAERICRSRSSSTTITLATIGPSTLSSSKQSLSRGRDFADPRLGLFCTRLSFRRNLDVLRLWVRLVAWQAKGDQETRR